MAKHGEIRDPLELLPDSSHPLMSAVDDTGEIRSDVVPFEHMDVSADSMTGYLLESGVMGRIQRSALEELSLVDGITELHKTQLIAYIRDRFSYKVEGGEGADATSLMIIPGVRTNKGVLDVTLLNAYSCSAFAGMFVGQIHRFEQADIDDVTKIAIEEYTKAAILYAFYEYLVVDKWLAPGNDVETYQLAAQKIVGEMIGIQNAQENQSMVGYQIAGNIAYEGMLRRLMNSMFSDDIHVEYAQRIRQKLCLTAIRLTDDEFFVGMASPMGKEKQDAYLLAALMMSGPRRV